MNVQKPRPHCSESGCVRLAAVASPKFNADGSIRYRRQCSACSFLSKRPWRRYLESQCSRCGFIPEDPCQLDVDHIDGNRSNNTPTNFQTLCANCHRLKTKQQKDYLARRVRP